MKFLIMDLSLRQRGSEQSSSCGQDRIERFSTSNLLCARSLITFFSVGAAYRNEPEPGVDPFGRKKYLQTLGFAFVSNWTGLPEKTRIKELKLNVQQVALAEAVVSFSNEVQSDL